MLWPLWMASMAPSATTLGRSVSQTPCARLMPPTFSQRTDMARISDWMTEGAISLSCSRELATGMDLLKNYGWWRRPFPRGAVGEVMRRAPAFLYERRVPPPPILEVNHLFSDGCAAL